MQIDRFCAQRDADMIVSGAGTAMCLYYVDRGEGGREGGREGGKEGGGGGGGKGREGGREEGREGVRGLEEGRG